MSKKVQSAKVDLAAENEALRAALQRLLATPAARLRPRVAADDRKPSTKPDPIWQRTPKVCPHCGKEKWVIPDFGIRNVRGVQRSQPWCNDCRASTNYHNRPRKNRSVNNP